MFPVFPAAWGERKAGARRAIVFSQGKGDNEDGGARGAATWKRERAEEMDAGPIVFGKRASYAPRRRMFRPVFILLLSLSSIHCGPGESALRAAGASVERMQEISQTPYEICDKEGFNPGTSSLDQIEKPYVVRQVRGRIFWEGGWPGKKGPLFEIRKIGKNTRIRGVHADLNGYFVMKNVREGRYCFKASEYGFTSIIGFIFVDKHADPNKEIFIDMYPALAP